MRSEHQKPMIAVLTDKLKEVQARWMDLPRKDQDELYSQEFVEPFARQFAKLPLHGASLGMNHPQQLVSVLGMSWQPVVLMTAWVQPEKMLVIGTEESLKTVVKKESVIAFISRVAQIPRDVIQVVQVSESSETQIYVAVRDFIRRSNIPHRQIVVDPTGGKKSMSAATALAAFLEGAPLVYVDYTEYHTKNRIPVAGTEYPRILANPLEILGDLELKSIFNAFNRGDFLEAQHRAEELAARLYEPREVECLAKLAEGYGAWNRFEFKYAQKKLTDAVNLLDRFAEQGEWRWLPAVSEGLRLNTRMLDDLVRVEEQQTPTGYEDGKPLLIWYLAAARRMKEEGRFSQALMLVHAGLERYFDLCLWIEHGLNDDKPDYSKIKDRFDREVYDKNGKSMFGKEYQVRELAGPLMFSNGAQLLSTLNTELLIPETLQELQRFSGLRNKCEFEHGLSGQAIKKADIDKYFSMATKIIAGIFGGPEQLAMMLERCRFPVLGREG